MQSTVERYATVFCFRPQIMKQKSRERRENKKLKSSSVIRITIRSSNKINPDMGDRMTTRSLKSDPVCLHSTYQSCLIPCIFRSHRFIKPILPVLRERIRQVIFRRK